MLPLPPLEESFLLGSIISPAYPAFLLPSCISGTHERGWELPGGTNPSYDHLPQGTAPGVWGGLSPMPECPCNSGNMDIQLIAFVRAGPWHMQVCVHQGARGLEETPNTFWLGWHQGQLGGKKGGCRDGHREKQWN